MSALEKNTNQLYRQKYFVEEQNVIRYRPAPAGLSARRSSTIIPARAARVSEIRVPLDGQPPDPDLQIAVQLERKGSALSGIRIQCPCGRHAEVDFDAAEGNPAGIHSGSDL